MILLQVHLEDPSGGRLASKRVLRNLKLAQFKGLEDTLCSKVIHGVFYSQCREDEWDTDACNSWLVDGRLRSETEGLLVAAQDGMVPTRAHRVKVMKEPISPLCRVCSKMPETIGHLLSACDPLKWTCYKERHDRVLYQLVRAVSNHFELTLPKSLQWGLEGWSGVAVMENSKVKVTVDVSVPTDRELTERRPDLIVYDRSVKRISILEVAVAWEPLIKERELEKRGKYLSLARDLANQWPGWSTKVFPVVVGGLGSLCGLRSELDGLGFLTRRDIDRLGTACRFESLCSAARILRQTLSIKD